MGALYGGTKNRSVRMESDFSGGVNTGLEPFGIGDSQSVDEVGFDTDFHPFAATPQGRTAHGSSGSAQTNLMTVYSSETGAVKHLVRAVGTALQYNSSGTTWTAISGTFANADWDSVMFNDYLILVNGTERKKWSGSALSDLGGSPPAGAKYVCTDDIRVWMAVGDTIHWSAYLNQENWTATENSGSVQFYTARGGPITGMRGFYGDKYVWKKDAMCVIEGTNFFNYKLREVSNDVGCVSFKTIQEVGDALIWLGETDVYVFQGGFPEPIGNPVRKYLNRINRSQLSKCCAMTDGIRYYLCLVLDNATEPNLRLVYDPRYGIWRVPAANENYRYAVRHENVTYVGDAAGQTYKLNTGTFTGSWSITGKPFDEGVGEAEKEYKELHFQGHFPNGSTLKVEYSTDQGTTWNLIDFDPVSAAAIVQNKNGIIPMDTMPLTLAAQFRLSGTGPVRLMKQQRYFRVCNVQH